MTDREDREDTLSEVSDLDPESRILEPVQRRIEAQLRKQLEDLTLQHHETSNELRMVRQRREDCGVELYNVQQHLAKLQESLERAHDNFVAIQRLHEIKLKEKSEHAAQSDAVQRNIDDLQKKQSKYQADLDKLSETLMKVEQFNEQIQSEIQIERRAAYKAEDEIVKLEKAKSRQDHLVDNLNERIKSLSEQYAALCAQVASQKQETKAARDTLSEALTEMEAINFEKKQLVQQWKTSIIGMQRRDEAMRITEQALNEQKEALQALDVEIVGYRQNIKRTQTDNAKLSAVLSKTENEVNILEKQIDQLLEKKQKATQRFTLLKQSLDQTDQENKTYEGEVRTFESEIAVISKRAQKAAKQVVDMENKVMETLNKQTTLKKGSQSALRDIEKLKNTIREKEMHVTQMENELARIRVDTLQTQSHNEVLKQTVGELEKELTSRDQLVEKMQTDIRRRHDEIERKQKQLDQLNRQFDGIIAAQGSDEGEHVGPLEATINNLSKSITQKSAENDQLQHEWIKLQTELVNGKNYNNQLNESIQELRAQCTILRQKRDRLASHTQKEKKEIATLESSTQNLHLEMKRINTLVCKNSSNQEGIANDTFSLENDLVKRLQERKREAVQLEKKIDDIRQGKADLLSQILNAERDVMFWEKKIQIAKETEMALDPNIGKDEINRMKREIYIMEQRLGNLEREQRRKVEELQKLIEHRDVLRTKGQAIQNATKNGQRGITKATVNKDNARLVSELNEKKSDAQQKDKQIKECLSNTDKTGADVERVLQEMDSLQSQLDNLQQQLDIQNQSRSRINEEKTRKQRSLQRFRDAEKGLYKLSTNPESVSQTQADLESKKRALVVVMQELGEQYPQLRAELDDVSSAL
jgi:chromosome segregation ATPase